MPQESDEARDAVQRLSQFVGGWDVRGELTTSQGSASITGRWVFAPQLGDQVVLGTMTTYIEGFGEFEEGEVIGFDPATSRIHLLSMNHFTIRSHIGDWVDARTLAVTYAEEVDGVAVDEVITITFDASGAMVGHVVERNDGIEVATTDLRLVRT